MYQVRIPATSANMGVGFDCAGLALLSLIHIYPTNPRASSPLTDHPCFQ